MSLRILFVPFGSEGDTNPLFWLADGLAARGHQPTFLLSPHYARHAESRGFPWHPIGSEEEFLEFAKNPRLWDAYRGPEVVVEGMLRSLPQYRQAFEASGGQFDLVVTSSFALGAASLADAAKIPRLTLHFQPICLRSEFDCPVFLTELSWLPRMPRWVKRLFFAGIDLSFWRKIQKPLNEFRHELGLPSWQKFFDEAVNGADGIAALFPDWYAAPQPDWPKNLRQFGFPVSKARHPLPEDLSRFLDAGDPPVVWTHGSANFFVREFQERAVAISRELGIRCLLVSLIPPGFPLPTGAFHCDYARFEDLLPRCAAAVHHGGIGTTAKCIAAGLPQLVIPRSHDQPDNAHRVVRLGLGAMHGYKRIGQRDVSRILQNLIESPSVAKRCKEFQQRMATTDPLSPVCDWAEEIARRKP